MGTRWSDGYSADVELYLDVGERRFRIAQVGPDFFILRDQCLLPPGTDATIVVKVDGHAKEHRVVLPAGASEAGVDVAYF